MAERDGWGQHDGLAQVYESNADMLTRRKVVLALSQAQQDYWFRARINDAQTLEPWTRRAFLMGANCLPADEQKHWYRAQRRRLDFLENVIVNWAQNNA